jgi:hypothetical protein
MTENSVTVLVSPMFVPQKYSSNCLSVSPATILSTVILHTCITAFFVPTLPYQVTQMLGRLES